MKLYKSRGKFYRYNSRTESWEFWGIRRWIYSEDANNVGSLSHREWNQDLKLIGNNFRLK